MKGIRSRIDYILKHNLIIQKLYKIVMSLFFKLLGLFIKTDNHLILFNGHGRRYNDSPKVIFKYIIENEKYKDYKIVWALDDPEEYDIPKAEKVEMDTLKYFVIALKAKYWVSCVNIERGLHFKKKQTIYLNTWHGTPVKLVGNAVSGRNDFNFSNIDIFCYSGDYEKEIFLRDFNVSEHSLLFSGMPRNDELYSVSTDKINDCKKKVNIPADKKVILYAPTWRDSTDKGKSYSFNPPIDIAYWQKELQDDYVLLLRTHAYTNKTLGIEFNEFVHDVSAYPDVNDLLMVADILISDYSATLFDYAILERPIICFGYDYDEYAKERGFYIDLKKELPSGVMATQDEVINHIKTMDYKVESDKTIRFKNKYVKEGGNATVKCVQKLLI
ncbi:CDP-glycerol glycerophosphotransferase family protein [Mesobacillus jeotgali]|uniref:CDP-glycerol glycerophosphotransferase family protein n=1 Tax=Mesobacillus jeotgali TaxID=129985 RepID=UPI001F16A7CA|nr:CDP-glycerol glycerophosphotransferase family protein [Mesobacillus jeotgali]